MKDDSEKRVLRITPHSRIGLTPSVTDVGSKKCLLRQPPSEVRECEERYAKPLKNPINKVGGIILEYLLPVLIILAFLFTLVRIEINTKKKLDNDERIIERLDLIINDLRKSKGNGESQ